MFWYNIPMRFRYAAKNVDYSTYSNEFAKAQEKFNIHAEKMKKARKIVEIKCESNGFVIILQSNIKLKNPSKSLAVFSRALAKMKTLSNLKDSQNHLLCNNGIATEIAEENEDFDDSVGEILKIVIDIFMGANATDDAFVSLGRREAQKQIIQVCREFKSLK